MLKIFILFAFIALNSWSGEGKGLSKDQINKVVQKHRQEIRDCYDAALKSNPTLKGKITIAFTIEHTGTVSKVAVKDSTLGSAEVESCIAGRFKSWHFPKSPATTDVTKYPVYLNPAN